MAILEELYNGNINPSDRYIKKGSDYQKINNQFTEYIDELMLSLNDKEKQLCDKIGDSMVSLCSIAEKECFIEGFCMGVKLTLEISNYKSTNFYSAFDDE